MAATHKGECFCGTVHVEVSGEPEAMGFARGLDALKQVDASHTEQTPANDASKRWQPSED